MYMHAHCMCLLHHPFNFYPHCRQDVLEGGSLNLWQSSSVAERISARVLRTHNGTQYVLKGSMDSSMVGPEQEYGQSLQPRILKKFKNGFPKAWKSLLHPKPL